MPRADRAACVPALPYGRVHAVRLTAGPVVCFVDWPCRHGEA